jgi:exosortase D (VPLPA-CTERM-specific)
VSRPHPAITWLRYQEGWKWLPLSLGLFALMLQSGLLRVWSQSEEYGHGIMVVGVLGYVIFKRRQLIDIPGTAGNLLAALVAGVAGSLMVLSGAGSGISLFTNYGILLFVAAAILGLGGFSLLRKLLVPLLIVILLFPLPQPLGPMLSAELQLISSRLGVLIIRELGGSVYLEGNVLDLGGTKLLVAEACAGLRYLFPLMSVGAIAGYTLNAPVWMRCLTFTVTIPITVFMNSLRIAVTGLMVEGGNRSHTEGFLHFFEGWVVFVVATLLLLFFIWALLKFHPDKMTLRQGFSLDLALTSPDREAASTLPAEPGKRGRSALAIVSGLVLIVAAASWLVTAGAHRVPERKPLDDFPMRIGDWSAHLDRLPPVVEEVAGASEYFFADYSSPRNEQLNLYIAYYESQRNGQIPHSPQVCIPGGGWVIDSVEVILIGDPGGKRHEVTRLVTSQAGRRVLAYYWLKQGAKTFTSDMRARLDLARYALLEKRTDGALVRLVTELGSGEGLERGDLRLRQFSAHVIGLLPAYVPD